MNRRGLPGLGVCGQLPDVFTAWTGPRSLEMFGQKRIGKLNNVSDLGLIEQVRGI